MLESKVLGGMKTRNDQPVVSLKHSTVKLKLEEVMTFLGLRGLGI